MRLYWFCVVTPLTIKSISLFISALLNQGEKMTPLEIKIEMLKKGITAADVGRKIGVSRVAVCRVRMGDLTSSRIQRAIAQVIAC